jgi:hypothetical protein
MTGGRTNHTQFAGTSADDFQPRPLKTRVLVLFSSNEAMRAELHSGLYGPGVKLMLSSHEIVSENTQIKFMVIKKDTAELLAGTQWDVIMNHSGGQVPGELRARVR